MTRAQLIPLIIVVLIVGAIVGLKLGKGKPAATATADGTAVALPRLVDLGSTTCIPCKAMAPVLAELKTEYRGKLTVEVIDVATDAQAADKYRIQVIPTQIFLDRQGKELFRHEGFYGKSQILAKMLELKMLP
jgi:thioredoxin 1